MHVTPAVICDLTRSIITAERISKNFHNISKWAIVFLNGSLGLIELSWLNNDKSVAPWVLSSFYGNGLLPDQCHFVYAPRQWVMMLQCNVFSHWLGSCREWSLPICTDLWSSVLSPKEYIQIWRTFQSNLQRIQVMEHIKLFLFFFRPQWVNPKHVALWGHSIFMAHGYNVPHIMVWHLSWY